MRNKRLSCMTEASGTKGSRDVTGSSKLSEAEGMNINTIKPFI